MARRAGHTVTSAATAELTASAAASGPAVLAFNVIIVEHAEAPSGPGPPRCCRSARTRSSSTVAGSRHCCRPARGSPRTSSTPLAVHLDHFQDVTLVTEAIRTAADLGATSIMADAGHLPYRDNVDRTRQVTRDAHAAGLWVEAELGEIGGKGNAHVLGVRTDPDEAAAYAEATGVDGLAVAAGIRKLNVGTALNVAFTGGSSRSWCNPASNSIA